MTCECGSRAESKNCENLLLPTADRRFDTKVKCPTGRASFWVKFPTVWSLTRVKCPGIARGGGMGGFGIDCYITCNNGHKISVILNGKVPKSSNYNNYLYGKSRLLVTQRVRLTSQSYITRSTESIHLDGSNAYGRPHAFSEHHMFPETQDMPLYEASGNKIFPFIFHLKSHLTSLAGNG